MARAGQIISNPVTGMTMKFIRTHAETQGNGWEVEYTIAPGKGRDLLPHIHLHSNERFTILQGRGCYRLAGEEKSFRPGDEIFFPARVAHLHPWNTGNEDLIMHNVVESDEAGTSAAEEVRMIEDYFEYWFHLANQGNVRRDGMPGILQTAVFLKALRPQIVPALIPVALQDLVVPPLAALAKMLGYRRSLN